MTQHEFLHYAAKIDSNIAIREAYIRMYIEFGFSQFLIDLSQSNIKNDEKRLLKAYNLFSKKQ